jgi:hypothetical protein
MHKGGVDYVHGLGQPHLHVHPVSHVAALKKEKKALSAGDWLYAPMQGRKWCRIGFRGYGTMKRLTFLSLSCYSDFYMVLLLLYDAPNPEFQK